MWTLFEAFWPYVAAVGAALAGAVTLYLSGAKAGENRQKVKEADRHAENLDRIKHAADARPGVSMHDDPNNRDG